MRAVQHLCPASEGKVKRLNPFTIVANTICFTPSFLIQIIAVRGKAPKVQKNTGGKHPRLWSVVSSRLLAGLHELLFVRKSDRKRT